MVIELQMARIKQEVNIGLEPYLGVVRDSRSLNDCDYLVQSRGALFEHLVWWGEALKAARQRMAAESGLAADRRQASCAAALPVHHDKGGTPSLALSERCA